MPRKHHAHSADPSRGDLLLRFQRLARGRPLVGTVTWYQCGDRYPVHIHDYAEMSWVVSGSLTFTTRRGPQRISTGQVFLHHPECAHGLFADAEAAILVNVAVPRTTIANLSWGDAQAPRKIDMDAAQDRALDDWLAAGEPRQFADLWHIVQPPTSPAHSLSAARIGSAEPRWFTQLLHEGRVPYRIAEGLPGLLRRAPCTREHLSRTCRRWRGVTLAELVRDRRRSAILRAIRLGVGVRAACAEYGVINRTPFTQWVTATYGCSPGALSVFDLRR